MARLQIAIDPTEARRGARVIKRELDDIKKRARETEEAVSGIGFGGRRRPGGGAVPAGGGGFVPPVAVGAGVGGVNANFVRLAGAIGAATVAATGLSRAFGDIVRNGDRLRQVEGRFKALTGSAERAGQLLQSAFRVGADTGAPFEAITQSLTRFTLAAEAIGATDEEVVRLTESVLKLGAIGGATTQELTSASIQLGQALASGELRGEELRSVMEQLPLVAREIAEGLGVGVGELRKMAEQGQLTADRVFGALLDGADEVDARFADLPLTVERAANRAATSWAIFTAELNKSLGIGEALIGTLSALAETLDSLSGRTRRELFNAAQEGRSIAELERQREILAQMRESGRQQATDEFGTLSDSTSIIDEQIRQIDALIAKAREASNAVAGILSTGPDFARGEDRGQSRIGAGAPSEAPIPVSAPPGNLSFPLLSDFGGGGGAARQSEDAVRLLQSLRERVELLREERQLVGASALEHARLTAQFEKQRILREFLNAAAEENTTITPTQIEQARSLAEEFERQSVAIARAEEALRRKQEAEQEAAEAARRHQENIRQVGDAIANAIIQAQSFEDALRNVATALLNIALQQVTNSFSSALGGIIGGIFGGGAAAFPTSVHGANLGGLTYAKGGAFHGGHEVTAFAHGGIVRRPTLFPMANGMGLMGEAGPEAVLPLRRGRGGRLGVESAGGSDVHIEVINNTGAPVSEEREQTFDGERIRIVIGEMVANEAQRPGSALNRVLTARGAPAPLTRR